MKSRLLKEAAASILQKLDHRKRRIRKDDEDLKVYALCYNSIDSIDCRWREENQEMIKNFSSEAEVEEFFLLNKIDPEDPNTLIASVMPYSVGVKLDRYDDD